MVVTLLVTGIPRFVSLTVLSYNLDSILSTDEVGKFRLREYTDVSDRHREVFVDFNSGFDAMCAQELLHDFELILENGSHNRLKAKIIGSSPSKLPSLSPTRKGRSKSRDSLMPYQSNDTVALNFDSRLQMIEKYKKVIKAETELVALKRKLQKEKKKLRQQRIESSETSDSESSSESKRRKRKKTSKKRRKSKHRSKSLKKAYRSQSRSPSPEPNKESSLSLSENEPSCSFSRYNKTADQLTTERDRGSTVRSSSKQPPILSTRAHSPSRSRSRHRSHIPSRNTSRFLKANRQSSSSLRSMDSSITPRRGASKSRAERILSPKLRRSRSRTRKLKSRSRSRKPYRRRTRSKSSSLGYLSRNRRRYSKSRSNSRPRKLRSPYRNDFRGRNSRNLISPYNRYDRKSHYEKSPKYRRESDGLTVVNVDRNNKSRITELDSNDEPSKRSPKIILKEKPIITDADRILILNKLEEASKSIVNEINIAVSLKHVAQLKILNLTEKEQAITVIKTYVDNYLRDLIPESMALAMTVVGIVRNFRMSFSKDEETKLVEGIINDIIRDRAEDGSGVVKSENSPILASSDWNEVDDLLRDIQKDDIKENSKNTEVKPGKQIARNPQFFLPIKKIVKQMNHILPLNFNDDEKLEDKFKNRLRKTIRGRISMFLVGKNFVSTNQIVEIYRENYPLESDLKMVNDVFITIIQGTDSDENDKKNGNLQDLDNIGNDLGNINNGNAKNVGNAMVNSKNDCPIVSENNKDMNATEDWQSVKIKQEATSSSIDDASNNTEPSSPTNNGGGQCIKLVITTIIKKEEDE